MNEERFLVFGHGPSGDYGRHRPLARAVGRAEGGEFLTAYGGRLGRAGSEAAAAGLRQQAAQLGRALGLSDARVAAGAMRERLPLMTNDRQFSRFLRAIGYSVEGF